MVRLSNVLLLVVGILSLLPSLGEYSFPGEDDAAPRFCFVFFDVFVAAARLFPFFRTDPSLLLEDSKLRLLLRPSTLFCRGELASVLRVSTMTQTNRIQKESEQRLLQINALRKTEERTPSPLTVENVVALQ